MCERESITIRNWRVSRNQPELHAGLSRFSICVAGSNTSPTRKRGKWRVARGQCPFPSLARRASICTLRCRMGRYEHFHQHARHPHHRPASRRRRTWHGRGHFEVQGRGAAGRRAGPDQRRADAAWHAGNSARRRRRRRRSSGCDWRENLGLPNRSLEPTLEARHKLAAVFRRVRPRWLFAPYWVDAHPDHVAATQLIEAARFWSKLTKTDIPGEPYHPQRIFNYYCVHLKQAAQPAFILDITALLGPQTGRHLAAIKASSSPAAHHSPHLPRPTPRRSRLLGQMHRHGLRRTLRLPRADWNDEPGRTSLAPAPTRGKNAITIVTTPSWKRRLPASSPWASAVIHDSRIIFSGTYVDSPCRNSFSERMFRHGPSTQV